jgi:hypothetical protein
MKQILNVINALKKKTLELFLRGWRAYIEWDTVEKLGVLIVETAVLFILVGHYIEYSAIFHAKELLIDLYTNIGSELIGMAITILIIDRLNKKRDETNYKSQLIRQICSHYNPIALEAAKELSVIGAFNDGTLAGRDMCKANLQDVELQGCILNGTLLKETMLANAKLDGASMISSDLEKANLKEASLVNANLRSAKFYNTDLSGASLSWADLTGAEFLTEQQLKQCGMLWGATMPDGTKYDGRFDLKGDIEEAFLWNVNYNDPEERKNFYCLAEETVEATDGGRIGLKKI